MKCYICINEDIELEEKESFDEYINLVCSKCGQRHSFILKEDYEQNLKR